VQRLQQHGFEAYLVGGCVRDLLLGQRPKDFDIATSALPQHVRRTFPRNCRIIGRRFKLAHLHFEGNRKILEVSTFRRAPEHGEEGDEDDLLITRDNEFGTAAEDALRRDFTINSLFYDPIHDELVDHADGLTDIEKRVVRTIGDPWVRFREDPVRILRAIKFSGRLGLDLDGDTERAMRDVAPDLRRAAPPRLLEEILRLLRGGHALDAFLRLRDIGALRAILPDVQNYLDRSDRSESVLFWRGLEALDGRCARASGAVPSNGKHRRPEWPPANGVLLATLFHRPVTVAATRHEERSASSIAEELITPFSVDFRLPRRDSGCLKRICSVLHRFSAPPTKKRFRSESFVRDPYFPEALELFELASIASGASLRDVEEWRKRAGVAADSTPRAAPVDDDRPSDDDVVVTSDDDGDHQRGRKRRKKRKRKDRGSDGRRPEHEDRRTSERSESDDKHGKKKRKRKRKKQDEASSVETIEPEPMDLSAFDIELDPKRVPTFGTIVEGESARKKRRPPPTTDEDEYRPPPPPGEGGAPPPPPPPGPAGGDAFGDW
jgi:poly(A) polymerase